MQLGLGLHWQEGTSYKQFVDLAKEAESLGYDQLWISNEKFFHEMYITATVVAENTKHVKIGTFVADPYSQHPVMTAAAIGTLDKVSDGRAILGIGAGGTGFPVMGIQRERPARAIAEAVEVIRRLWKSEEVDFKGEVIQCDRGCLNFQARADIPVVVASRGKLVLQTAGKVADGAMIATFAEPIGIGFALEHVARGAERANRKLEDITLFSRVDACIHPDRKVAFDAVRPMVAVFLWTSYPDREFVHQVGLEVPTKLEAIIAQRDYNLMAKNAHLVPDAFVEKFCWAGTADEVAEKVRAVTAMGMDNITILPHPPQDESVRETMQQFAQVIRPKIDPS